MLAAASIALVGTLVATPGVRHLALALDIVDRPAQRKFHTATTPYLGGVAIVIGLTVSHLFTDELPLLGWQVLLASVLVGAIGLLDDVRPMQWKPKLAMELAATVAMMILVWSAAPQDGRSGATLVMLGLGIAAGILITNSFNLIDNMDGHMTSVVLASSVGLTLIAMDAEASSSLAVLPLTVAATCAAFLVFNLSRRFKIFLGDAGSLMLGFLTTITAVMLLSAGPLIEFMVALPLLLFIPALDTATVVVDRTRHGFSIFTPGKDHLSHRLVRHGLGTGGSVTVLAAVQLVASLVAVMVVTSELRIRWLIIFAPVAIGAALIIAAFRQDDLYGG